VAGSAAPLTFVSARRSFCHDLAAPLSAWGGIKAAGPHCHPARPTGVSWWSHWAQTRLLNGLVAAAERAVVPHCCPLLLPSVSVALAETAATRARVGN